MQTLILFVIAVSSTSATQSKSKSPGDAIKSEKSELHRKQKSFGFFPYLPQIFNYPPRPDLGFYFPQGKTPLDLSHEWLSRTEPFKRKNPNQLLDSPIYYVRLPANPYIYVPGMGYISRPTSLSDPELLNSLAEKPDTQSDSNFINLPIDFVSNGKPDHIYQLPNDPVQKPKPDSTYFSLNKGPYYFNGKPVEVYVLQNSYNAMYADALTNFYP